MADTLRPVGGYAGQPSEIGAAAARPARPGGRLVAIPAATLALFLIPIGLGLLGTWAPALGVLPALGRSTLSLDPWR